MAPPRDMFSGRELIGDELDAAERAYPIGSFRVVSSFIHYDLGTAVD